MNRSRKRSLRMVLAISALLASFQLFGQAKLRREEHHHEISNFLSHGTD